MRIRCTLLLAAALALLPGANTAAGQGENPVLTGTVGPGFVITLTTADGQPVTTLVEGTYTINVSDKAAVHDFHLFGPDVNQATTVPAVTDTTWTVTLKPGAYAFVCDPHTGGAMRGTFTVVAATRVAAALDMKQVVGRTTGKRGSGTFTGTVTRSASGGGALAWKLSFRGLTGPALAAHIHVGLAGHAGKIIVPLCTACKSGASGTANVDAATLRSILSGGSYVNVHTRRNPAGEIRGQLSVQG
jgi:plastocyanin